MGWDGFGRRLLRTPVFISCRQRSPRKKARRKPRGEPSSSRAVAAIASATGSGGLSSKSTKATIEWLRAVASLWCSQRHCQRTAPRTFPLPATFPRLADRHHAGTHLYAPSRARARARTHTYTHTSLARGAHVRTRNAHAHAHVRVHVLSTPRADLCGGRQRRARSAGGPRG